MFSALIIDADSSARSEIERALTPYGFEFDYSEDAGDGVAHARDHAPDLIFLRVELPSASGFSVCNKLRRSDETKYIPLVMYAAEVADDVFEQHRNLRTRADGYLRLPLNPDVLVDTVGQIIELPAPQQQAVEDLEVDLDDVEMLLEEVAPPEPEVRRDTLPATGHTLTLDSSSDLHLSPSDADDLSDETDAAFAALTLDEALGDDTDLSPGTSEGEHTPAAESEAADASYAGDELLLKPDVELPDGLEAEDDFELPASLELSTEAEQDVDDEVLTQEAPHVEPEPPPAPPREVSQPKIALEPVATPELRLAATGSVPPRGRFPMPSTDVAAADRREPEDETDSPSSAASSFELDMKELEVAPDEVEEATSEELTAVDESEPEPEPEPEPSSSGSLPTGTISLRRENLNLKSQIVARDREILRLKDEIASAKRGVLDAENRARGLEREVGELQSKVLTAEDAALTAQEQNEAAQSDRRTMLKREEGLKVRLDVQQKKAQKLEKELRSLEQSVAENKATYETALARAKEEASSLSTELEQQRQASTQALSRLASFEQDAAQQRQKIEALTAENQRLSENVSRAENELNRVKRQAEADFIAAQEQADKELEEKLGSQADEHQAQLEFQERAAQERQARMREEWDAERGRLQTELGQRNEEVASLRRERAELTEELGAAQREHGEAIAQKEREAAAARQTLDARIRSLESELDEVRGELRASADLVYAKSQAIERATQALAVALKVLE